MKEEAISLTILLLEGTVIQLAGLQGARAMEISCSQELKHNDRAYRSEVDSHHH